MADEISPPEYLIELRVKFEAAEALAKQISEEEPEGEVLTLPGGSDGPREKRLFSDEQNGRLNAARATARELAKQLTADPWRAAQPDRHAADKQVYLLAADRRRTPA